MASIKVSRSKPERGKKKRRTQKKKGVDDKHVNPYKDRLKSTKRDDEYSFVTFLFKGRRGEAVVLA